MLCKKGDQHSLVATSVRTLAELILALLLVLKELSVTQDSLAPLWLVLAVNFETLQLVLEGDRYAHHLDAFAAHRAQGRESLGFELPLLNAAEAEDVATLRALAGVLQQVLADRAHEVGALLLFDKSLKQADVPRELIILVIFFHVDWSLAKLPVSLH